MPSSSAYPLWRRMAATGSLTVSAAGLLALALHDAHWHRPDWGIVGLAAVTGAAAAGMARRSVLAQVLARGAAWVIFAPTLALTVALLLTGNLPDAGPAAYALATGTALVLARPALHTDAARREFSPVAFRQWFLAGAVGAAAMGLSLLVGALEMLAWHAHRGVALLGAMGAALVASAVGVARMRAWGVLLAGLASAVAVIAGVATSAAPGAAVLALAAFPGVMLLLPVLASRLHRAEAAAAAEGTPPARTGIPAPQSVPADAERPPPSPQARLAADDDTEPEATDDVAPVDLDHAGSASAAHE